MKSQKTLDKILIIAFIFVIMFLATVVSVPFVIKLSGLDAGSRTGLLTIAAYQAVLAFVAPSLISAKIISVKPFSFLTLARMPGMLPIIGVMFAYLISLPALNQLIYWNENFVFPENMSEMAKTFRYLEDQALKTTGIMLDTDSMGGLITGLLIVAVLTGFSEELFFRATLQKACALSGRKHLAVWAVAFVFSAIHFQIFGFIPRLLLGAWFGYLFLWTGSIYVPVVAHVINNGVVVLCSWLNNRGVETNFEMIGVAESGFPVAAFVSMAAIVVFLTYFRNFFFKNGKFADNEVKILNVTR